MAVFFDTAQAAQLLVDFDAAIAKGNALGGIATWKKLSSGHYTHTSTPWGSTAFFLPTKSANRLTFNIVKPQGKTITIPVYGYYHGHLIETMLNHFDKQFTLGAATSLPAAGDSVN